MKNVTKISQKTEYLDATTRKTEIVYSSAKVLSALLSEESGAEAVNALVSFIIGATTDGGKINEREYLAIYPSLVTAFGPGFDFYSVKRSFDGLIVTKRIIRGNVATIVSVLKDSAEITLDDVLELCLLILTPTLGKLSLKHKAHLARLTHSPKSRDN